MELTNDEILSIGGLLIKFLRHDIEQKNIKEQVLNNEFKEFKVEDIHDSKASRRQLRQGMLRSGELASLDDDKEEKRKRGRPFGSFKKNVPSER